MATIEAVIIGKWYLLIEEDTYDPDSPILLSFSEGIVSDGESQLGEYRVEGNTVFAPLGDNAVLEINAGNRDTGTEVPAIEPGVEQLPATLRTSFNDGGDDLIEYATLIKVS